MKKFFKLLFRDNPYDPRFNAEHQERVKYLETEYPDIGSSTQTIATVKMIADLLKRVKELESSIK